MEIVSDIKKKCLGKLFKQTIIKKKKNQLLNLILRYYKILIKILSILIIVVTYNYNNNKILILF